LKKFQIYRHNTYIVKKYKIHLNSPNTRFPTCLWSSYTWMWYLPTMYIYCVNPAMSNRPQQLPIYLNRAKQIKGKRQSNRRLGFFWNVCAYIVPYCRSTWRGSMSSVVGLPNNSYKPITNMACVRARLCKLQKGYTRLATASDKVYQLLAHGRWFSLGIPDSSTTKTDRHDIHL
jgi:hypothetical protein